VSLADQAATDLDMMFSDWGVSITYKAATAVGFSAESGTHSTTSSDTALTALRETIRSSEVAATAGGIAVRISDLRYGIKVADLAAEPEADDQIVDGAETFRVLGQRKSADENLWWVYARRVP